MKISVSLSEDDVAALDKYAELAGLRSRSAAIQRAIHLLGDAELENDYAAAWEEWDPIRRARRFLERYDGWDDEQDEALMSAKRAEIRDAIRAAEQLPKPSPTDQFKDIFATPDRMVEEQLARLADDLRGAAR